MQIINMRLTIKLIALAVLILPFGSQAQKVKKEGFGFFNYFQPRSSTALDDAKYYFLKVDVGDGDAYRRGMFEEQVVIADLFEDAGVDNEPGFTINIVESPFKFGTESRKSYAEKYKQGDVEKSRTVYYYISTMSYQYMLKVLDKDGNELVREVVSGSVQAKGRTSNTARKAHDYYIKDKLNYKENAVKGSAEKISDYFNDYFTDAEKTVQVRAPRISGKHDYSEYDAAFAKLEKAYELLNGNKPSDEANEMLDEAIVYWTELLKESDVDNKKAKVNEKVTAATQYNLGLAHFFKYDFVNANKHFENTLVIDKNIMAGVKSWAYITGNCAERIEARVN